MGSTRRSRSCVSESVFHEEKEFPDEISLVACKPDAAVAFLEGFRNVAEDLTGFGFELAKHLFDVLIPFGRAQVHVYLAECPLHRLLHNSWCFRSHV